VTGLSENKVQETAIVLFKKRLNPPSYLKDDCLITRHYITFHMRHGFTYMFDDYFEHVSIDGPIIYRVTIKEIDTFNVM
jgi:hypothetical protein